ncbi:hypothetical protein MKZ38_000160 [Zalerion maritima]|uniref:D-xylose 1-dehydrogenase (NADP(+), D-xylono-1,5-lactone-forming) n=1 Tax=Zalerion maritima TaxID=339359 RepID=A0AAD5WU76_9PEZI|nr:hypothetical protein MKZ38_000160 [Zalerion maritima]
MSASKPTLRWGIIGTGLISSWFVQDLCLERENAQASHIIQVVGSSSVEKGNRFIDAHVQQRQSRPPPLCATYEQTYRDPDVDIVYIGTPHAFHKQNCLDAIAQGKHVLCEKPFALNAKEAREVFKAAGEKGVFVMEALWTRFFPLFEAFQRVLHRDEAVGDVVRVFCDFAMNQSLSSLDASSRLKNPALGAGSLLDIGIYSLTWGLAALDSQMGGKAQQPKIVAAQTLVDSIDVASAMILLYPDGKQGILTCNTSTKTPPVFCRVEGTKGHILVEGVASSAPRSFTIYTPQTPEGQKYEFERPGKGFYWEADSVALDIAAGKTESVQLPWAETLRVLDMLDEVRRQGGAKFPQD